MLGLKTTMQYVPYFFPVFMVLGLLEMRALNRLLPELREQHPDAWRAIGFGPNDVTMSYDMKVLQLLFSRRVRKGLPQDVVTRLNKVAVSRIAAFAYFALLLAYLHTSQSSN
ncbi:hypothetical protein [Lysobacter humi (ex Lee et al. 2017)]